MTASMRSLTLWDAYSLDSHKERRTVDTGRSVYKTAVRFDGTGQRSYRMAFGPLEDHVLYKMRYA
jgi:hypothetical protein